MKWSTIIPRLVAPGAAVLMSALVVGGYASAQSAGSGKAQIEGAPFVRHSLVGASMDQVGQYALAYTRATSQVVSEHTPRSPCAPNYGSRGALLLGGPHAKLQQWEIAVLGVGDPSWRCRRDWPGWTETRPRRWWRERSGFRALPAGPSGAGGRRCTAGPSAR